MLEGREKRAVGSRVVKVLVHRRDGRGMVLEPFASRCVRRGEVHELVTTDHTTAKGQTHVTNPQMDGHGRA